MENLIVEKELPLSVVGGLVVAQDGQILLVKSHKWSGLYGVPGGKVDPGETLLQAFHREVKEETGLAIEGTSFALWIESIYSEQFWKPKHFLMFNYISYLAPHVQKEDVILNEEAQSYLWVSPEEALRLPLNRETDKLVRFFMQRTTTKVGIEKVPFECRVGILPHEYESPQRLDISLEAEMSGLKTCLEESFDYTFFIELVHNLIEKKHYPLLEELGKEILGRLKVFERLETIKILLEKPLANAFVEINWSRR